MSFFKSTILILTLFSTSLLFAQASPFQKIYQGHPLELALTEIQNHFGISISWSDNAIQDERITCKVDATDWQTALNTVLKDRGLEFTEFGDIIVISPLKKNSMVKLSGILIDDQSRESLIGVSIWFPGLLTGTTTDIDGYFEISVPAGNHKVIYSSVGYQQIKEQLSLRQPISIERQLRSQPQALETVEVIGSSFAIGNLSGTLQSLTRKEILHSPSPFRDVFRTLRTLPGYSNDDISSKPRIRGGHWDETATFLDGLEIYEPFHLEEVEGLAGIFETDLISTVKVLNGGFGPRYTDKLSGIIEMETPEYIDVSETSISVDFLATKLLSSLQLSEKDAVIFSARRGYLDLILDTEDEGIKPTYFDIFGKWAHRFNTNHTLSFDALYAQDDIRFARDQALIRSEFYNSLRRNLYLWSNWKWLKSSTFNSQTTIGFQRLEKDATFAFESSLTPDNIDFNRTAIWSLVNRNYVESWPNHHVEFGTEWKAFDSEYQFGEVRINTSQSDDEFIRTDVVDVLSAPNGFTGAFYSQDTWSITPKLTLQYGLRLSGQSFTDDVQVAPRATASWSLTPDISLSYSYGTYYQPDNFQKLRSYDGQALPFGDVAKSNQQNANLTYNKAGWLAKINLYHKDNVRLFEDYRFDFYNRATLAALVETPFGVTSGVSKGIEFFSRYSFGEHLISLSYSLAHNRVANSEGQETFRDFDRRHSFSINSIFNFRKHFSVSGVWNYYSGNPYTPNQIEFVGEPRFNSDAILYYDFSFKNSGRLPSYHSLDLKVEKTVYFRKSSLNFYLSILNLYDKANIRNFIWNADRVDENGNNVYERAYISGPEFFVSPGLKFSF